MGNGLKILVGGLTVLAVLLAAGWFLLRRPDIPYAVLEQRYETPTSRYVDLPDGVRAHYRDDGGASRPVVILVHGFGDSFLSWAGWIHVLARDFRVLTVDMPGHGLTRAPKDYPATGDGQVAFISAFAEALKLDRFAIAGNSMGGGIAWRTAIAQPDKVSALILLDAAGWPSERTDPPSLAFRMLGTPVGRLLLETLETRPLTAASLKGNFVNPEVVTPEFVTRWVEVQRAPGHRRILMTLSPGSAAVASPSVLSQVRAPTLVQHGAADRVIPASAGRKFAEAIPGARLILYPNVGHMPQLEIPEQSASDAAAFLRDVLPSPQTSSGQAPG